MALPLGADLEKWVLSLPRGPYTTARVFRPSSVLEFRDHVKRLSDSGTLMMDAGSMPNTGGASAVVRDVEQLQPILRGKWKEAISNHFALCDETDKVGRLTSLITWTESDTVPTVHCMMETMPPRPKTPVAVRVLGHPRSVAKAKDSKWVEDRRALAAKKLPDENEVVLRSENSIYEGLSSNFFAVDKSGCILTAPNGILEGTVRRMVVTVCETHDLPIRFETPTVDNIGEYNECFLTSTSRVVLPIDIVRVANTRDDDSGGDFAYKMPYKAVGERLFKLVDALMDEESEAL